MSQLFSPNSGMNGPLGANFPDRFRTLGTGLAEATVGAIVADRKQNQSIRWGTMAPGCDGLPNLNTLTDVTCCSDDCPEDGTWVLINTQHGIPTLASAVPSRPFAGTSGPPVIFRAPMSDPCITDVRVSLLDTEGNKWRIVEETVDGVKMTAGSLRSTGNTPAATRVVANYYRVEFAWFSAALFDEHDPHPTQVNCHLVYPALTGADTGVTTDGVVPYCTLLTASGVPICAGTIGLSAVDLNLYYGKLGVANRGFIGEAGWHSVGYGDGNDSEGFPQTAWDIAALGGNPGNQMVQGTCATTGCGRVQTDQFLFGIEAPLPAGELGGGVGYGESGPPNGPLGVMVRDATATGAELLRPLSWTPLPYYQYTRRNNMFGDGSIKMNILTCEEGSVFVHPVGVKTVWQFRYDTAAGHLVLVRTITIGTGGAAWDANTILSAVLENY